MANSAGLRIRAEGGAGIVALDRPDRANAYLDAMLDEMRAAIEGFVADGTTRAIVVTSTTGGKFCAGADLHELRSRSGADALDLKSASLFENLARCPLPTIAAIDGPAVGGGLELALACDVRIATPRSLFAFPETSFGILPAAGGTFRLPRVVGPGMARQMILLGQQLDAAGALQWGLVNEIVEPQRLEDRVKELLQAVADRDPLALRLAKQAIELAIPEGDGKAYAITAQAVLYPGGRGSTPGSQER